MTTTTEPSTQELAMTTASTPRISKNDRISVEAVHIAAALEGSWTVRGGCKGFVAVLCCLSTGIRIGLEPWKRRAWGYCLVPIPPGELWAAFSWPDEGEVDFHPGFAVGIPAAEVATHIRDELIARFHRALERAENAARERDEARYRLCVAHQEITALLQRAVTPTPEQDACGRIPVRVQCNGFKGLIHIQLTMPVEDAIARAPALAHALIAPDTTVAAPQQVRQ